MPPRSEQALSRNRSRLRRTVMRDATARSSPEDRARGERVLRFPVLEPLGEIVAHEAVHRRLFRVPPPRALRSDGDVRVRVEIEFGEGGAETIVSAVREVAVPQMEHRALAP